jgi:hypothetical protein
MIKVIKTNCLTGHIIETAYNGDELHVALFDANLYNTSNQNFFAEVIF